MTYSTRRRVCYWLLDNAQWFGGAFIFFIGLDLKFSDWLNTHLPLTVSFNIWMKQHGPVLLVIIPLGIALCSFVAKKIGRPWVWESVRSLLDSFRDCVFDGHQQSPVDHHRVTIFRHYKVWWGWRPTWKGTPWSGWLVAVARSGHLSLAKTIAFRAPDQGDECEGVAGATWARKACVLVEDLPDLSQKKHKKNVADYAKNGYVSKDWLERHGATMRSLYGIPLEVENKLWGVIVLDSRSDKFTGREKSDSLHKVFSKTIGKLISKA